MRTLLLFLAMAVAGQDLKSRDLDQLLFEYENFAERASRRHAALADAITKRAGSLEFLCAKLKKSHDEVPTAQLTEARVKAAHLVGFHKERAKRAVPLLIALLEDESDMRMAATMALEAIGPAASEALPVLLEELHFRNTHAPRALMAIGPDRPEVIETLTDFAENNATDPNLKSSIVQSFIGRKPKSERLDKVLLKMTESQSHNYLASEARMALGLQPKEAAAPEPEPSQYAEADIPMLVAKLRANPDSYPVARALGSLGPKAADQAVPIILEALKKTQDRFRMSLISRLGEFGEAAAPAVPLLIRFTEGDNIFEAQNALSVLGRIGPAAREAKDTMVWHLNEPDLRLGLNAAIGLLRLDPHDFERAAEAWAIIERGLMGENREFQHSAIYLVGTLGADGAPALGTLRKLAAEGNETAQKMATAAIAKIERR